MRSVANRPLIQKHGRKTLPDAEQRRHWGRVAALGCIVTGSQAEVTIHHCRGGSIVRELGGECSPGGGERQNHWLVIPLHRVLHVGQAGIDNGLGLYKSVDDWERDNGELIEHLNEVSRRLNLNVFRKAGIERAVPGLEDSNA